MQRRTPRRRWEHDSRGSNPRDPRMRPAPKATPADHHNPYWHCAPPHSPWQPSHPSLNRLTQRNSPAGNSRPLRLPALCSGCSSSPYRSSQPYDTPQTPAAADCHFPPQNTCLNLPDPSHPSLAALLRPSPPALPRMRSTSREGCSGADLEALEGSLAARGAVRHHGAHDTPHHARRGAEVERAAGRVRILPLLEVGHE